VEGGLGDVKLLRRLGEVQMVSKDRERSEGVERNGINVYSAEL
jgi:hypothetical protein